MVTIYTPPLLAGDTRLRCIDEARRIWGSDELQTDIDAKVIPSDPGKAWVQVWVLVDIPEVNE